MRRSYVFLLCCTAAGCGLLTDDARTVHGVVMAEDTGTSLAGVRVSVGEWEEDAWCRMLSGKSCGTEWVEAAATHTDGAGRFEVTVEEGPWYRVRFDACPEATARDCPYGAGERYLSEVDRDSVVVLPMR